MGRKGDKETKKGKAERDRERQKKTERPRTRETKTEVPAVVQWVKNPTAAAQVAVEVRV